ncbi:hypothetical protein B0H14DRAFT_2616771 [Mycena olivaceomarginata]|nr:hypothetical protein B0H14DRAFT_2616771 [Mycena olivaceomarginata]
MCDTLSTSILFGTLSLLPGNRYIALGLGSATLIIYAANRQRPTRKLGRVERTIQACEETLKHAKSNCARNHVELTDGARRLLEAKLSASKIQSRLLETHSVATWEELVEYLLNLRDIMQKINHSPSRQNANANFLRAIKELREIHDTVISVSARHTQTVTRRIESIATSMFKNKMVYPYGHLLFIRYQISLSLCL